MVFLKGTDFNETFALVHKLNSCCSSGSGDTKGYENRTDIVTAYLNGKVQEEIFMEVPDHLEEVLDCITQARYKGYHIRRVAKVILEELEKFNVVCRLNKALYGLRQANRTWHSRLDKEL